MTAARILFFGTMVHPMKTLLGIVYQVCWPIYNLGHDLLYVMDSGFPTLIPEQNQLGYCCWAQLCILWRPWLGLLTRFVDLYLI